MGCPRGGQTRGSRLLDEPGCGEGGRNGEECRDSRPVEAGARAAGRAFARVEPAGESVGGVRGDADEGTESVSRHGWRGARRRAGRRWREGAHVLRTTSSHLCERGHGALGVAGGPPTLAPAFRALTPNGADPCDDVFPTSVLMRASEDGGPAPAGVRLPRVSSGLLSWSRCATQRCSDPPRRDVAGPAERVVG